MRGTRGTETSKYPEEKKTTVIPRVVASESGEAQTEGRNTFGVTDLQRTVSDLLVELTGKLDETG